VGVAQSRQLDAAGVSVRRLAPEDLTVCAALAGAAFGIDLSRPADRARWRQRVSHPYETDPDGCFVAEAGGRVIGVAEVLSRDAMWILSLLAVDPEVQSAGAGRALMDAALSVGEADGPGLIVSSDDSRALRLYALAGFRLRPTFQAEGSVCRAAIPASAARVRDDAEPDFEALAALSRAVRGAEHTPDLRFALRRGGCLLTLGQDGFAIAMPGHGVWLLVAREAQAGRALLWRALELAGDAEGRFVRWILDGQDWAVDVVCRAGLRLSAYGGLAVRGEVGPLQAFLPSAPFA
jgi:ribosomal protein S18 acetylase RimI-like enzyme